MAHVIITGTHKVHKEGCPCIKLIKPGSRKKWNDVAQDLRSISIKWEFN